MVVLCGLLHGDSRPIVGTRSLHAACGLHFAL